RSLLTSVTDTLQQFTHLPLGTLPLQELDQLKERLKTIDIATEDTHLFHADLKQGGSAPFTCSLKELQEAIGIMSKLTPDTSHHETQLDRFKKRFTEKYE